ncbi:MAG: hypothetical protein P1U56_07900 [Saprospiraceae bacterium]|nr:hypothetical protein [Saprospiraceae bacterium]
MKPVFIEETIAKLKNIIESTISGVDNQTQVDEVIDQIEKSLKGYKDNKENRILFYTASLLIVVLSLLLTYTTHASWPLMFLVIWFGGFMYYRVHEKSLVLNNLSKLGEVNYKNPLSSISYLKSAIDLKVGRKSVLKIFLSVMFSCTVMMAHFLFVDTAFWMNFGLLLLAIVASFFFWTSFYKEEINALESMKDKLHQLENKIILSGGLSFEEEE